MKTDLPITEKPAVGLTGCYVQALISMTDFVMQIDNIEPKAVNFNSITDIKNHQLQSYSKMVNYAQLLKQPIELGMFVPCDLEGKVLEEPENKMVTGKGAFKYEQELQIYCQAKERLIFEGFEIMLHDSLRRSVHLKKVVHVFWETDKKTDIYEPSKGLLTIEDLVKYGLSVNLAACT